MFTRGTPSREKWEASSEDSACTQHDSGAKRQRSANIRAVTVAILLSLTVVAAEARPTDQDPETELAKEAENPISDVMRFPVSPFTLNRDWNLITRMILPVIKQPTPSTTDGNTWGLGATQFSAFLSPNGSRAVT
jgi:hypothetical protein